MASRGRSNGELPQNLHFMILVKLPVKSSCRFWGIISDQLNDHIPQLVGEFQCLDLQASVRIQNPAIRESFNLKTESEAEMDPELVKITNHFGFDPVEKKHKVFSTWRPGGYAPRGR
ncbi:hypothetical protein CRG98_039243 [Punica granatum]|uniref:F-box associated beta-propeller type 3 domain-containing protein n=1 Tax=Punica granatum TaxID=22663 RepID=A0A2I0I8S7_PUNGR|nr:hypothetical protein CRG98_039243 [Punica granatum]